MESGTVNNEFAAKVAALRDQLDSLERDEAVLLNDARALESAILQAQQEAMKAIEEGDDDRARRHVVGVQEQCDAANAIGAELTVIRAMVASYREALQDLTAPKQPQSDAEDDAV